MNQITQVAQTVEIKQTIDFQKTTEEFVVSKVRNDNNQFNMTITNSGDIPIHLTRLWVENTTDSLWPVAKFDLNVAIPSGGSVINIGQGIGLTALDTQSYKMKLVTERGNTQQLFVNSVGSESLYLNFRAQPTLVPTGFSSTIILEVVNTGTQTLLNLKPELDSVIPTCNISCSANLISGPTPTSFDSLKPGNTAIFIWDYKVTGSTDDFATFTASLVGGIDERTAVVTVNSVLSAENAQVSLESGGVAEDAGINDSILLFHMEQALVPFPGYQMMSTTVDGGTSGLQLNMETQTAGNAVSFFTNNGSQTITIPAGDWNAALALRSEPVAASVDTTYDMIFHFEDGVTDNSEGDSARDLEGCGGVGCSGWYNAAWSDRKQIIIQGTPITGGPHTDYPLMVKLVGDSDLLANAQANGDDILFTNSAGTIKYDHEIEYYADGSLIAWVKIPSITSGSDTAVCMYFGNAAAANQENVAGTWSDNYEAVYHFHNDFTDSAKTNDGTNFGSVNATGIAAGGQDFELSENDYVDVGTWSVSGSAITMSAWVNWESFGTGDPRVIAKGNGGSTDNFVFMLGEDSTRVRERIKTGSSDGSGTTTLLAGAGGTMSTGTWHYMAASYDGSFMRVFLDGTQEASVSKSGSLRENLWDVWIGNAPVDNRPFDGIIDEVRISSESRSADFQKTEYNMMNNYASFVDITSGAAGDNPTYDATAGPHSSGSFKFNGVSQCFRSVNDVSDLDGNAIKDRDTTTSLWFKTDGVGQVNSEEMLVFWEGGGSYPNSDYYKISLGGDGVSGVFQERIAASADDAEQDAGGSMDVAGSSTDFELVYDGNHQWIGLRYSMDVPQGVTITSASIKWVSDESQTGTSPSLIIGAEDTDNASAFTTTAHNVDDRWDGTTNTVTSAKVTWSGIPGWDTAEEGPDTTTPSLITIVQEIVDRPGWVSGNNIVFIFKDNSGGSNTGKRTAEHWDTSPGISAQLTVAYDNGGATGKLLFEVSKNLGGDVSTCLSTNEYDDGAWHHVVAVNSKVQDKCELYITDTAGADEESTITHNPNHGSTSVDVDGKWYVGTAEGNSAYFKGWIDDIMHWDNQKLSSTEADDLSHTNYGTGSHQLNVNLDLTDSNGVFVSNLYNGPITSIPFQDSKELGTADAAFTMYNVTMSLPETVVAPLQRLNFSMAFNPSTTNWEALQLDMKIDDIGFTNPYPSYLQIPMPDNPFASYVIYNPNNEMELFVNNVGDDGIYFIYSGTRLSFYSDTLGSFAALIHHVNGTTNPYLVDINKDSIYIPANESAQLFFYQQPTDHPCQGAGSSCQNANIIPDGIYTMAAWVNGYSDQGETFGRTVQLGTVTVKS